MMRDISPMKSKILEEITNVMMTMSVMGREDAALQDGGGIAREEFND